MIPCDSLTEKLCFFIKRRQTVGVGGEIQLADAISAQAAKGVVEDILLQGQRFDCGSLEGYLDAVFAVSGRHTK